MLSGHTHGGQICLPGFPIFTKEYPYIKPGIAVLGIVRRIIDNNKILKDIIYNMKYFKSWMTLHKYMWVINNWNYAHGLFKIENEKYLGVSRGIGAHYSLRLFCQPEITCFTILPNLQKRTSESRSSNSGILKSKTK